MRGFFKLFGDYNISTLLTRPIIDFGNTDYKNKNLKQQSKEYNEMVEFLITECNRRRVSLLANKHDPGYERNNKFAVVYEKAVMRYLGPSQVWKDGFDFRSETYREHMRRIRYRRELLKCVLQGNASLVRRTAFASSELL